MIQSERKLGKSTASQAGRVIARYGVSPVFGTILEHFWTIFLAGTRGGGFALQTRARAIWFAPVCSLGQVFLFREEAGRARAEGKLARELS